MDNIKIQSLIEQLIKVENTPSLALAIYDNGKITYYSAGMADIENGIPSSEDTAYAIGSATKSFVATAICALVSDGKISFDNTVRSYIPEFEMYDSYVSEHLTVRDILCHRCGLPRHEFSWYPRMQEYKPSDMVAKLKYLEPNEPFRYTMQYQNHMFMLAGYLVERVTGMPWEKYLSERVLKQIGMTDVSFSTSDLAAHPNASKAYAFDGEKNTKLDYVDYYMMGAAGCINMPAKELIKWIAFHLNNGKVGDNQIIDADALIQSHQPQMIISADSPFYMGMSSKSSLSYGLGWVIENYRGRTIIQHGGNVDGYSAKICFVPNTGFGVAILTNADKTLANETLPYKLIDMYFGDSEMDHYGEIKKYLNDMMAKFSDTAAAIMDAAPKGTPMPDADEMAGTYMNPGYGDIIITVDENGNPKGKMGACDVEFIHVYNNGFFVMIPSLAGSVKFEAMFSTSLAGKVTALQIDLEPTIKHLIKFNKI